MTFFTLGNHHDFAVLAIEGDAEDPLIAAAADGKLWNSTVTIVPSRANIAAYIASALDAQAQRA